MTGNKERSPTNTKLTDRISEAVAALQLENPGRPVPIDLVTTSASGLDPHISPAAAEFQVPRVARERAVSEDSVRQIVAAHTEGRQFGFLGEPVVNVLELNLDIDRQLPRPAATTTTPLTMPVAAPYGRSSGRAVFIHDGFPSYVIAGRFDSLGGATPPFTEK